MPPAAPPTEVPVEPALSYARRAGDVVRVVAALPADTPLDARRVWMRFRGEADGTTFRVPAQVTDADGGRRVVAEAPAASLTAGVWGLALRVGRGGPLLLLGARLLTADDQPVALLPG